MNFVSFRWPEMGTKRKNIQHLSIHFSIDCIQSTMDVAKKIVSVQRRETETKQPDTDDQAVKKY